MLTKQRKKEVVKNLSDKFSKSKGAFLIDYIGTNVEVLTNFRKELLSQDSEVQVVRNTLMNKALEEHPEVKKLFSQVKGTNAVVFIYDEAPKVAKTLKNFSKKVETLKYKKGLLLGEEIDENKLIILANLPSRSVVQAQLLAVLQAPMSKLVRTLNEVPRGFVGLLDNYKNKNQNNN